MVWNQRHEPPPACCVQLDRYHPVVIANYLPEPGRKSWTGTGLANES